MYIYILTIESISWLKKVFDAANAVWTAAPSLACLVRVPA